MSCIWGNLFGVSVRCGGVAGPEMLAFEWKIHSWSKCTINMHSDWMSILSFDLCICVNPSILGVMCYMWRPWRSRPIPNTEYTHYLLSNKHYTLYLICSLPKYQIPFIQGCRGKQSSIAAAILYTCSLQPYLHCINSKKASWKTKLLPTSSFEGGPDSLLQY